LTLLELCHTTNYKRKILNYLLSSDSNLQILKTLNFILKKAKNKQEMGTRAVFVYDFLNGKTAVESLALLIEQNPWMVEDLIDVRNQYVSKVDPLVYKIELLLHNVSTVNAKVRKVYEKFKVEGEYESEDDK
jgi:DNA-binding CsgD family transcriptional regulator